MRPTFWVVGLAVLNAGCSLVSDGAHVIAYRTSRAVNDSREWHRDCRLADAAWDEVGRPAGLSADHADGFKEGFANHLFRGACEPPPLPPAKYRRVRSQTPAGYRAAEDWLTGFRHGVAEAHARGFRDLVTGPSAFRTLAPPHPIPPPTVVQPAGATVTPPAAGPDVARFAPDAPAVSEPPRLTWQRLFEERFAVATSAGESTVDSPAVVDPTPSPPPPGQPVARERAGTLVPGGVEVVVWWKSDDRGGQGAER